MFFNGKIFNFLFMKNRNYLDARSGIIERSRRIFDIAFRSIQLGCLYPKRENSRQAWKWLAKSLQCVLWQTVSGLLRSVHLWLVGVSIGSAHKCFRGMNEQDTPLEPFQAAQLLRGRCEREKERERASQGMPTWPRVPSRCRTFLHSARIIAREDERGNDRSI